MNITHAPIQQTFNENCDIILKRGHDYYYSEGLPNMHKSLLLLIAGLFINDIAHAWSAHNIISGVRPPCSFSAKQDARHEDDVSKKKDGKPAEIRGKMPYMRKIVTFGAGFLCVIAPGICAFKYSQSMRSTAIKSFLKGVFSFPNAIDTVARGSTGPNQGHEENPDLNREDQQPKVPVDTLNTSPIAQPMDTLSCQAAPEQVNTETTLHQIDTLTSSLDSAPERDTDSGSDATDLNSHSELMVGNAALCIWNGWHGTIKRPNKFDNRFVVLQWPDTKFNKRSYHRQNDLIPIRQQYKIGDKRENKKKKQRRKWSPGKRFYAKGQFLGRIVGIIDDKSAGPIWVLTDNERSKTIFYRDGAPLPVYPPTSEGKYDPSYIVIRNKFVKLSSSCSVAGALSSSTSKNTSPPPSLSAPLSSSSSTPTPASPQHRQAIIDSLVRGNGMRQRKDSRRDNVIKNPQ